MVPSFYWKYEWSYNEFMIHRVGKLESPSKSIVMYDMLGNVWEWVRDDWSSTISSLNGKVNPIVDSGDYRGVIKGGAFDQFCRKVVSAAREDLNRSESKSKYGTQSNVGFRPSLTFTVESEGGVFVPGVTPVDLFFLFDASASQDSEINKMLEQAKKIVAMFSGDGTEAKNRDICHVGSALFMGNNIKLMCSNQVDTLKQTIWNELYIMFANWIRGKKPKNYKTPTYYRYSGLDNNCPWKYSEPDENGRRNRTNTVISGREDWINIALKKDTKATYNTIKPMLSSKNTIGETSGLRVKFNNWKNNRWMSGSQDYVRSARSGSKDVDSDSTISFKSALREVELEREV